MGTKDVREDAEKNYVRLNFEQFIYVYLLMENIADDNHITNFLINFLNKHNNYKGIPK